MLYFLLIVLFCVTEAAGGTINRHEYNFTIAYANNSTSVLLVNNQFRGPMIRANVHDKIIVHSHNALRTMEEVTIHFHGILQQQTPQMDGAGFVIQMPIPSQQTFTYVFYAYGLKCPYNGQCITNGTNEIRACLPCFSGSSCEKNLTNFVPIYEVWSYNILNENDILTIYHPAH